MTAGEPGGPGGYGTVYHPEPDPPPAVNGGPVRIGQLRPLPRRRRPAMIALAVALICAGVLGGAALYKNVNHQVPVLVVSRSVPAGSIVTGADLGTVTVAAGPGLKFVPAAQEHQVTGLVAATTLEPGSLLTATDLTTSLPPASGQVLVPVSVKPSQLPVSPLSSGDQVLVVPTPGSGGTSNGGSAVPAGLNKSVAGVVEAVSPGAGQNGLAVVDLLVPARLGPVLAKEDSTGNVALIVTSRGR